MRAAAARGPGESSASATHLTPPTGNALGPADSPGARVAFRTSAEAAAPGAEAAVRVEVEGALGALGVGDLDAFAVAEGAAPPGRAEDLLYKRWAAFMMTAKPAAPSRSLCAISTPSTST